MVWLKPLTWEELASREIVLGIVADVEEWRKSLGEDQKDMADMSETDSKESEKPPSHPEVTLEKTNVGLEEKRGEEKRDTADNAAKTTNVVKRKKEKKQPKLAQTLEKMKSGKEKTQESISKEGDLVGRLCREKERHSHTAGM